MSEPMSRRDALLGAVAVCALARAASGDDQKSSKSKPDGSSNTISIEVQLSDGQVVKLQAASAYIGFNGGAGLIVRPTGILPLLNPSEKEQNEQPFRKSPKSKPVEGDEFPADEGRDDKRGKS